MKKSVLLKIFLLVLVGVLLIGTTGVFAVDDDDGFILITENSATSTPASTTKTPSSSSDDNNTNTNTNVNANVNNNNTSVYNNNVSKNNTNNTPNSLSKAGLEDSLPTLVLVVVATISAIYAYKKVKEYRNI